MALKIVYSGKADQGLNKILEFVTNSLSAEVAEDVFNRVVDRVDELRLQPYIGVEEHRPGHAPNRIAYADKTVIRYQIDGDDLVVLDIFDARSDWKK